MNILRNTGAVLAGLIVGSIVNMGLVISGSELIPAPDGVDVTDMEALAASIHLFEPVHFVFPFLAHALGTLVGATLASFAGTGNKMILAMIVGTAFLLGGIANTVMLPAPIWFDALDLVVAYLPMGWLGWKLTTLKQTTP